MSVDSALGVERQPFESLFAPLAAVPPDLLQRIQERLARG
jgi:hypothetical protein